MPTPFGTRRRTPPPQLYRMAERDARAKENVRFGTGLVVEYYSLSHTVDLHVGEFDANGSVVVMRNIAVDPQVAPSIGDTLSLQYNHSHPAAVVAGALGLGGSNGQGTIKSVPHPLLDGSIDSDTVATPPVKGSLVVANSAPLWDALSVGADGKGLLADSTQPHGVKWGDVLAVAPYRERFVGDNTTVVFTLAHTPKANTDAIYRNGLLQDNAGADYTLSGAVVTFGTAPETGDVITALYWA